jgi:hypothetical protein
MKTIRSLVTRATRLLSICLLALLIGGATIVHAQERQLGFYFTNIVPRGEFSENGVGYGVGGSAQFLVRLAESPFLAGGDVGLAVHGVESRREPIDPTMPDLRIGLSTTNNIFFSHFVLRAQPRDGPVLPYVDGLIGLKRLYTTTEISDSFSGETIDNRTDLSDTALSYGFGGGLQIPLPKGRESRFLLDMNVRYLRGARAVYLREGSIREENGQVVFDVLSSRTDVLAVQIGFVFRF